MYWMGRGDGVKFTHVPTQLVARSNIFPRKNKWQAMTHWAKSLLAAKVAKLKEDPEWKEGKGPVIRSYHLNPYLGIEPFVKDERSGKKVPLPGHDWWRCGRIDELLRAFRS
jgi:hypothetical protein